MKALKVSRISANVSFLAPTSYENGLRMIVKLKYVVWITSSPPCHLISRLVFTMLRRILITKLVLYDYKTVLGGHNHLRFEFPSFI